MPIIDSDLPGDVFTGNLNAPEYKPPKEKPGFAAAVGAAFKVDNTAVAIFNKDSRHLLTNRLSGGSEVQQDYDPLKDPRFEQHTHDADFVARTRYINTPELMDDLISTTERTNEAKQVLSQTSGFNAFMGYAAANLLDPLTFVPYAGAMSKIGKAGSALKGAATFAAVGVTDQALRESVLNPAGMHTNDETALNIASASVLSAMFGGAVHGIRWDAARNQVRSIIDPNNTSLIPQHSTPHTTGNAGAAKTLPTSTMADEQLVNSLGMLELTNKLGGTPGTRMMDSPSVTARQYLQQIRPDNIQRAKHAGGIASYTPLETELGMMNKEAQINIRQMMAEGFDSFRKTNPGINETAFSEMVYRQKVHGDLLDQSVINTAAKLDKHLSDAYKLQQDRGFFDDIPASFIAGYLPRVYDQHLIKTNRAEVLELFKNNAIKNHVDPQDAEHLAQDIVEHITGHHSGVGSTISREMQQELSARGIPAHMHQRLIDIPTVDLMPYLDTNIERVMNKYMQDTHTQVLFKDYFDGPDMKNVIDGIHKDYNELVKKLPSGDPQIAKLEQMRNADIDDAKFLRDQVMGKRLENTDSSSNMLRRLRATQLSTKLGAQLLSSFTDLARPIQELGFKNYGKALWNTFKPAKSEWREFAKEDLKAIGVGMELMLGDVSMGFAEIAEATAKSGGNRFDTGIAKFNTGFMKYSGMTLWNDSLKTMAVKQYWASIGKLMMDPSKLHKSDVKFFAKMGIGKDMYQRIGDQFRKHSEDVEGLLVPNTAKWDDAEAARLFKISSRSAADIVINTPHAGDLPQWMHKSPVWKTIGQFTTFAWASHIQMLVPMLQNKNMAGAFGFGMMLAIGAARTNLGAVLAERDPPKDAKTLFLSSLDRAGGIGIPGEIANRTGLFKMLGEATGVESEFRKPRTIVESMLGPGFGTVAKQYDNIREMVSEAANPDKEVDWRKRGETASELIPGQNLFGIYWIKQFNKHYMDQKTFADGIENYKDKSMDQLNLFDK